MRVMIGELEVASHVSTYFALVTVGQGIVVRLFGRYAMHAG